MLASRDSVAVGVSGGADSMALLHFLRFEAGLELNITACHVNHMIRGKEADSDENFVRDICKAWGIEFKCLRCDVISGSRAAKQSVEEYSRRVRYDFFRSCAKNGKIATAHTLSDAAETLIFNIARGSSVSGLCSIPPVRGNIIRPLIFAARSMIEEYCARHGIDYVTDSTNLTDDYSRNKIRHKVVPVLKQINPAFEQAACRLMLSAAADDRYLNDAANRLLKGAGFEALSDKSLPLSLSLESGKLTKADEAVLSRAAAKLIDAAGISRSNEAVSALCGLITNGRGRVCLSGDIFANVRSGRLYIEKNITEGYFEYTLCLSQNSVIITDCKNQTEYGGSVLLPGGKRLAAYIVRDNEYKSLNNIHKKALFLAFDCDKILGKMIIRQKTDGDRIKLRGMTKTLKKLFNAGGLSAYEKSARPVCADESGVIGVFGFGVGDNVTPDEDTKRILAVTLQ